MTYIDQERYNEDPEYAAGVAAHEMAEFSVATERGLAAASDPYADFSGNFDPNFEPNEDPSKPGKFTMGVDFSYDAKSVWAEVSNQVAVMVVNSATRAEFTETWNYTDISPIAAGALAGLSNDTLDIDELIEEGYSRGEAELARATERALEMRPDLYFEAYQMLGASPSAALAAAELVLRAVLDESTAANDLNGDGIAWEDAFGHLDGDDGGDSFGPDEWDSDRDGWPDYDDDGSDGWSHLDPNGDGDTSDAYGNPDVDSEQNDPNNVDDAKPVILDLDGNGIQITELSQSTHFQDTNGDGLESRTAWAGAGDGVLFYDPDNLNDIVESNQYIFSEWDPTAASDIDALRAVFDNNGDGVLDANDDAYADFKVMITKADGSTEVKTLADAGITSIDLTPDATHIELPDGSVITGQTTYTKADGSTGKVGDVTLVADGNSYRVVQDTSVDGRTVTSTAYDAGGAIAFVIIATTSTDGSSIVNEYDDDGDGVVDRIQTIDKVTNPDGSVTETVQNFVGADINTAVLANGKETTTSADGLTVTIDYDSTGGGWTDHREVRATNALTSAMTITESELSEGGDVVRSVTNTVSADGLTRTESVDLDGDGDADIATTHEIVENADGTRTETVEALNEGVSIIETVETTDADGQGRTVVIDLDGDGDVDVTQDYDITVNADGSTVSVMTVLNGDGSLQTETTQEQSDDALVVTISTDVDGDDDIDLVVVDETVLNTDGSRAQTVTVSSGDDTLLSNEKVTLGADKVSSEIWVDLNQDGVFQATDLVQETSVDATTQVRTTVTHDRNTDGSINVTVTEETSADGLTSTATLHDFDLDDNGTLDVTKTIVDYTVVNSDGSTTQTVVATNADGSGDTKTVTDVSQDGQSITTRSDIDGDDIYDVVTEDELVENADGSITRTSSTYAGDYENFSDKSDATLLTQTVVTESADRLTATVNADYDGDGNVDYFSESVENADGSIDVTETTYYADGTVAGIAETEISDDGLVVTTSTDVNGDGVLDSEVTSTTTLADTGISTTDAEVRNGDGTLRSETVSTVSADGLVVTDAIDADGDGTHELTVTTTTNFDDDGNGSVYVETGLSSANGASLGNTLALTNDDGLVTTERADVDGNGTYDVTTTSTTELIADGSTVTTTTVFDDVSQELRFEEELTTSGDGRSVTSLVDVNGDGEVDQTVSSIEDANGDVTITETWHNTDATEQATGAATQSQVQTVIEADGLTTTTSYDMDGDGTFETVTKHDASLDTNGDVIQTVDQISDDGIVRSTWTQTISDDGLHVETVEDWNADGTVDRTTVTNTDLAVDGVVTESIGITNADGNLIYSSTTETSADGRDIEISTDADGNGVVDENIEISTADSGVTTSTSTYYTEGGGVDAVVKSVVSGDELSSAISIDTNGDGKAELISTDVTALNQDGSIDRSIEHRNYRNISLASEEYFTSDDGFYSTASFDLDGDGTYEFITEESTVFEDDGDVVQTMVTQDAQYDTLAEVTVTTSGNGLVTEVAADFTGDGNVDRIHNVTVSADGSSIEESLSYDGGSNLQSATTVTTSADGRTQVLTQDRDGDGNDDLRVTSHIDLDRTETVLTEDLDDDGSVRATVDVETLANGSQAIASFDVDGDGDADITRSTNVSYDSAGNQIVNFTETYGAENTVTYEEETTSAADGLSSSTTFDMDGDGDVDATATNTVTLNDDGSRLTEVTSTYTDGELHYAHSEYTSADGRTVTSSHDYDGNSLSDLETSYEVKSDGATVRTVQTFNEAGYELNAQITTTSADGLTTTIQRGEITQTYSYSAVQNGSYTWDNGVEAQETGGSLAYPGYTHVVVTHEIDALGIETWTVTEQWKKNGKVQTNTYEVQLDATAKEEILAEAARIYDTLLDRDMDSSEVEMLAKFVVDGELNAEALTASILVGEVSGSASGATEDVIFLMQLAGASEAEIAAANQYIDANPNATLQDMFDEGYISAEQASLIFGGQSIPGEFSIRYGELSDAEFINQIYLNAYGRPPSLVELEDAIEAFNSGAITQAQWALEIAESAEHLAVGNGHRITNNYDVILNPAEYERNLDEAYVRIQIEKLVDVIYDRDATEQEIAHLSELLMQGDGSDDEVGLDDIAQLLLDAEGGIYGVATNSLNGLSGEELVTQAFINALGRAPDAQELQSWVSKIESEEITEAQFVAALSESLEHAAEGNSHVAVLPGPVVYDNSQTGTSNAETLNGTSDNDQLNGKAGNDTLSGKSGDDELLGMNGADILHGDAGHDILKGGSGWDDLHGGDGNDTLVGEGGKDDLYGGNGADSLTGGLATDVMDGGNGSDTYIWQTGDGNDTIHDTGSSQLETDTLHLTNVLASEVVLVRDDGSFDLLIKINSGGTISVITVKDHFKNSANGVGIEEIVFSDGTVWALEEIISNTSVVELEANNVLIGVSNFDETFYGFTSDDTIDAKGGDDTLVGGLGADILKGGDGADTYIWALGDGDDTINDAGASKEDIDKLILSDVNPEDVELSRSTTSNDLIITIDNPVGADSVITVKNRFENTENGKGIDVIEFADGTVWTMDEIVSNAVIQGTGGNDSLNGGNGGYDKVIETGNGDDVVNSNSGDDTIDAGAGQDTAIGGEGSDTYIWSWGDAHYTDNNGDIVAGNDVINDTTGAVHETDRLVLTDVDSDQVTLTRVSGSDDLVITIGVNGGGGTITVYNQFENVNNGKGLEEIEFADGVVWNVEDITTQTIVHGTSSGETLNGISDYDETFYAKAGADTINAKGGDDLLVGGLGYDELNGGNGNDLYIWSSGDGSDIINDDGASTTEVDTLVLTDVNSEDVTLLRSGEDLQVAIDEDGDGSADEVIVVENRFSSNGNGSGIEIIEYADGVRTSVLSGSVAKAYVWGTGSSDSALNGWAYTDTIYGYAGADTLNGNGGDDLLIGGNGLDTLYGGTGSDTYQWSAGHGYDVISDTASDINETDTLVLTDIASNDVLLTHGSGENDLYITVISTGEIITVEDQFTATDNGKGIEAINFSDGVTWQLDDIYANTSVLGDLNIDPQVSTSNQDTLNGVSDFDENFYGLTGDDIINAGAGDDFIVGGLGDDDLRGEDGNDTYQWSIGSGEDTINDDGESTLETDRLILTDVQPADVALTRESGTDDLLITIATTSGNKVLTIEGQFLNANTGHGIEAIEFADGTVWLLDDIIANTLVQGDANDNTLTGASSFDETFEGYLGADTINAGHGDDLISGGLGDDVLDGEQGSDTYIWSLGDGDDVIDDDGTSINDIDRLVLTNVDAADVVLERAIGSTDLTVVINGTATITLKDQYGSSTTTEGIEVIEFADAVWTLDDILANVVLTGSPSSQTINGSDLADTIDGRGGADAINGNDGDDVLIGGWGADTLNGGAGIDTASYADAAHGVEIDLSLTGAQIGDVGDVHKNDTLTDIENVTGSDFDDELTGDEGANVLSGNDGADLISGGVGYDTLVGGAGNDTLTGGANNDDFVFAVGDGMDTVTDFEDGLDQLVIEGLTFADLTVTQSGTDTLVDLGSGTSITLQGISAPDITEDDFQFI